MKKFLVFVMIAVVALGIGFTTFRFTVKQQIIKVDTTAIECNQGDTFALDIQIKNKKKDTTVTAVSNNSDIVALSNAAGDEYKFEAKRGGKATITVSSNLSGFVAQQISVTVGDGSSEDLPLCISSVDQYKRIGTDDVYTLNKCYKLVADLSFDGNYQPLGNFSGKFDFAGHRLSDIAIEAGEIDNVGLFGSLASEAIVKNLVITDFASNGSAKNVGAVAGINNGQIRDVQILKANIENSFDEANMGGVAGQNFGKIKRVFVDLVKINTASEDSTVGANSIVGGLVGLNGADASVYACSVVTNIAGGLYVGGVAGQNDSGLIENCAVGGLDTDSVVKGTQATTFVGGIVGYNKCTSANAAVADCYALTSVGTEGQRGAIIGKNENGIVNSMNVENPVFGCYYNQNITGTGINKFYTTSDYTNQKYDEFVAEKSVDSLKEKETFVSYKEGEDNLLWQFDTVWFIASGNIPTLNPKDTAGIDRVPPFIAENGGAGELHDNEVVDANTNYKITKDITIAEPIPQYNAVMEGVKKADNEYPTITFAYSNFTGDWAALFGTLGSNGHIKNLKFNIKIENVVSTSVTYYAMLVAHNNGEINNVEILNTETSYLSVSKVPEKSIYIGGIVADNKGQVLNSRQLTSITVSAASSVESYVGGVVARTFEDSNISNVKTGTALIGITKTYVGYVGGIVGLANSNVLDAINYAPVSMLASSDDTETCLGGVVGKVEGRNITISKSANFATLSGKNVGGVIGITVSDASASNVDITISQCMSKSDSISGLRVGGIIYSGNCGLIQNCLSKNHLVGATGEPDKSTVAGLIYRMNVNENGIIRAYNCVSNCTFGTAGRKFYEDANAVVFGKGNKSSILRGGFFENPLAIHGCVDVYALTNCYAINRNDSSVERTNGWAYQNGSWIMHCGMGVGETINAKSDHLIDISNSDSIQEMKTVNTEKLVVVQNYIVGIPGITDTKDLTVEPFSSDIWTIGVGNIALNAFTDL